MIIVAETLFALLALFLVIRFSCAWLMRKPRAR
jgi:hypothetical protein